MAINKRLVEEKNGVLEKNAVTYPRTGNIMAMYSLDDGVRAENGMLLEVDYVNKLIKYPASTSEVIMIVDSAEKEYDPNNAGLDKFYLTKDSGFKPRLGKLEVNDRFTTSTVSFDTTELTDIETIGTQIKAGTVYGTICEQAGFKGTIALTKTKPESGVIALKAIELTTLPNGDTAIKFTVIKAN